MSKWLVAVVALAGCVSQGSYDALQADRDLLALRVSELETKVATLEAENTRLSAKIERTSAAEAARAKKLAEARATLGLAEGQKVSATMKTTKGDIRCELWPEVAPVTVTNFVQLAEGTKEWTDPTTGAKRHDPLYDGTIFHRVIQDFMIQGGDPAGTGRGGPGYTFEDETPDDGPRFDRGGLLAMANAGPDTNGSQFFVTVAPTDWLTGKHTIFGEVTEGYEVVEAISKAPTGGQDRPSSDVVLERVEITD
jgi:peptidyl-prolyl cis-trans isomerase A (cyclophilin A)